MRPALVLAGVTLATWGLGAPTQAAAQSGPALCRTGQTVEYVKNGRRYPGRVDGDNGTNCLVYAKAYMGVIDVAYRDLRPDSGATEDGKPDLVASGSVIVTTPREIVDAFARGAPAAKSRFVGQHLRVTGSVFTFRND